MQKKMEQQQTSQSSTSSLSVETQLALMNQTLTQTKDDVKDIKQNIRMFSESSVNRKDLEESNLRIAQLEKDRDADRSQFGLHLQDYAVNKSELGNVKKIVYTAVGIILTAVLVAVVGLVIISRT